MLEDDLLFEPGRRVTVAGPDKRETEVEYFRRQHGHCIVKFRGVDNISEAEKLIGAEIQIETSQLRPLEEGWFYTFQLKGCTVFSQSGEELGTIVDVLDYGGAQVLKVDRGSQEMLIPFAQEYLRKIDLERQRVEVDLPDDLRELNK